MTFQFKPGVRYRMPVVFGPSISPRQHPSGRPWKIEETGNMNLFDSSVHFISDEKKLNALLPPGFSLRGGPIVKQHFMRFGELYWLAGRSYGAVAVFIPVVYEGKTETIEGNYLAAIWEGDGNAVMTGREEMGFPKLNANIPERRWLDQESRMLVSASWYDHRFFEMEYSGIKESNTPPPSRDPVEETNFFFKYFPHTAMNGTGGADVAYATTGAPHPISPLGDPGLKVEGYKSWTVEKADFNWNHATFEQLPLTHHVVNGMADLPVLEIKSISMSETKISGLAIAGDNIRMIEPKDENLISKIHPAIPL